MHTPQLKMYIRSWKTWLFIAYLLAIIYFTLISTNKYPIFTNLWQYDKIIHLLEYFVLGYLLINAIKIKPILTKEWNLAILFLIFFPFLDEYMQYYSPNRIPDIYDAIYDIIGGLMGAYLRRYL